MKSIEFLNNPTWEEQPLETLLAQPVCIYYPLSDITYQIAICDRHFISDTDKREGYEKLLSISSYQGLTVEEDEEITGGVEAIKDSFFCEYPTGASLIPFLAEWMWMELPSDAHPIIFWGTELKTVQARMSKQKKQPTIEKEE